MTGIPAPRRAPRRLTLAFALLAAACAEGEPAQEDGFVTRWGGDLLGTGGGVRVDEVVDGDAMLAGGDLRFSGATGGDYIGAGGRQLVEGEINGNVRAAGGDLDVGSRVGRNATLAGGSIRLREGSVLGGNAYLAGGRIEVSGTVEGHLRAAGGDVLVDGVIGGDVNVESGHLRMGPGARIGGNVRYRVPPEQVEIDPGAQIAGEIVALPSRERPIAAGRWALRIAWGLGFLLAGSVLVALFPGTALEGMREMERRLAASVGFGLLWFIGVPVAIAIVLVTVIGIPLAAILLASFLALLYVARVVPAIWLGRRIMRRDDAGRGKTVVAFLVGAIVLLLVGLVPILGILVWFVTTLLGTGALLLALRRDRTDPGSSAVSHP